MSSSNHDTDVPQSRRRPENFLVDPLTHRLEEGTGSAGSNYALDVKPTTQDKTIQALEEIDVSGRLLQTIVEEFQAVGRLPITVPSSAVAEPLQGVSTTLVEEPAVEALTRLAAGDAIELINEGQTDEFADLFEEVEQAESEEQARAIAEMVDAPQVSSESGANGAVAPTPVEPVVAGPVVAGPVVAGPAVAGPAVVEPSVTDTIAVNDNEDEADLPEIVDAVESDVALEDKEAVAAFDALAELSQSTTGLQTPENSELESPSSTPQPTPTPAEPTPVEPEPTESKPVELETVKPTPVAPTSVEPAPIDPVAANPMPVDPAPAAPEPPSQPVTVTPAPPTTPTTTVENLPAEFVEGTSQPPAAPPVGGPSTPASVSSELDVLNGTQTIEAESPVQSATYQFRLEQISDFNLVLEGLEANADVALLDSQGNVLQTSSAEGLTTELLGTTLASGDYQLQITSEQATDYRLVLTATPDIFGTANNLQVSAATYLGGSGDDTASAVEFSPQRELVVAGNFGVAAVGSAAERSLLGSNLNSAGQIVRLSASGQDVLSITHLGNDINDMDLNRASGTIVAGGDFGIAVLNAAADQVLWSNDLGGAEVERVAIANDGTVVTLHDKTITVWSPTGEQLAQETLVRSYVEDVTIDPETGAIYVAGYDNKYNVLPVQVAFLTGFDSNLNTKWSSWGFEPSRLDNDMADTRGYRVTVGHDGNLYYLGEVAGGNSIYRWNGKDLSSDTLVAYDAYNTPYNSKSPHQTYYARINPETGEVLQGQLALSRLSDGASNAVRVFEGSITADEAGNVYIGGRAFSGWAGREQQTINGQSLGEYTKSDPFALVVSSDFKSRRNWTSFVEEGAQGSINAFAVGDGRAAVLGTIDQGSVITESALNANAFNAGDSDTSDVYLATWGTDTLFDEAGNALDLSKTIANFSSDDQLTFSAANFNSKTLQPGALSNEAFVLGSQPESDRATFLYDGGVLSYDPDGTGARAAYEVAQLPGNPGLKASQIVITGG